MTLPVVDVGSVDLDALDRACQEWGFFYVTGHDISPGLEADLRAAARAFFDLDETEKAKIAMANAGRAWRGWFPIGGELTSGVPDQKEGLYFGAELGPDHPRVRAGTPLHGANLFPDSPSSLRFAVGAWMEAMAGIGHVLLDAIARALDAGPSFDALTADPLVLFRIFNYPAGGQGWGVGEHTDYGLLTLLGQDGPGLSVRTPTGGWIDVPPAPGRLVCNLGDVIERASQSRYRSTAHRVRNAGATSRLSYPFFFDPSWDADIGGTSYGDYIVAKVTKVFPELMQA